MSALRARCAPSSLRFSSRYISDWSRSQRPLVEAVVQGRAALARRAVHLDGAGIFAAQVVQIGDVVIGLRHQQRHFVAVAIGARPRDRFRGPRGNRMSGSGRWPCCAGQSPRTDVVQFPAHRQGAPVALQGLVEAVHAVQHVAHGDIQAGQVAALAQAGKDRLGAAAQRKPRPSAPDTPASAASRSACARPPDPSPAVRRSPGLRRSVHWRLRICAAVARCVPARAAAGGVRVIVHMRSASHAAARARRSPCARSMRTSRIVSS